MDTDAEFPLVAIGDWYQTMAGELLEVVATDEAEDTLEVQFFDGTVGEFDAETWRDTILAQVSPPEDWTGSLDVSREDYTTDADDAAGDYSRARRYLDGS
jgi:hypothetical protein